MEVFFFFMKIQHDSRKSCFLRGTGSNGNSQRVMEGLSKRENLRERKKEGAARESS